MSVYFGTISKNWHYFYYFAVAVTILVNILSFFYPESPVFLYEKGKCEQAREVLNRIAAMNGSKLATEPWVLDKEDILAYAPEGAPELTVKQKPLRMTLKEAEQTRSRNTLKPIGNSGLLFQTSGDLSPSTNENPFEVMKRNPQVFINL